ncbi:MAG TPA: hypothetical protein VGJ66_09875 [Pyrinomonadaceae bacterium]
MTIPLQLTGVSIVEKEEEMIARSSNTASAKAKPVTERVDNGEKEPSRRKAPACPWMELERPSVRTLKVYALDPSAGNYVGNVMSVKIKWEEDLQPGPIGRKIAVIDYDGANKRYYPPVDLNDPRILARGGLDPSESDPRFHQQMVYAVASETIERFEVALGRRIRWRRADRPPGFDETGENGDKGRSWRKTNDIWTLNLFPHAMVQANAFYSPEAKGILFGYFTAEETNQGRNLPGQRVFTCLSHDIIAHEVTHAIIDGIRTYFTEPTNHDVLAFHEAFSDLAALFSHFWHEDALLDTIQKTGGRLYQFELKPDAAPTRPSKKKVESDGEREGDKKPTLVAELSTRNPLIDLAQQFGEASAMNRGLRSALDIPPNTDDIQKRVNDVHFRGSILVAAVFDAYFSIYLNRTADLFRVYRAGGGSNHHPDDLPGPLARLLAEQASSTAAEFFQLCARALDYCPPVDITFGDFLRALITANLDLKADDGFAERDALMQAFRVRGIYPENAAFFSQDSLCWPRVPKWTDPPAEGALPPVEVMLPDPETKQPKLTTLVFGDPNGLTREEQDVNGRVLRQYAEENAERLGFDADPSLPLEFKPYAPSFHPMFRIAQDGSLRTDMVVELVQTKRIPFDERMPQAGSFPFRGGVTLIISAPTINTFRRRGKAQVRYAIGKKITGAEGERRKESQREHNLAMGLVNGDTEDPNHFQVDFGLLHQGL